MTTNTLPPAVTLGDYPIGAVIPFAGAMNQESFQGQGWLYCNGNSISRSQYAPLFSVIGTAFGNGDGTSTFDLPDFRGYFLRGADNGRGTDPDAASRGVPAPGGNSGDKVGSIQGSATARPGANFTAVSTGSHTHSVAHVPTDNSSYAMAGSYQAIWNGGTASTDSAGDHSHTVQGGDMETVPV
ncbi:MAG TPA: phage tail protein, partial [Longimicrobium sp.]|nr:phage tail protein [Longimicrobium sp.]